jgi:HlyD family secretion protein
MKAPLALCLAALAAAGCQPRERAGWSGYAEGDYVYVASPVAGTLEALDVRAGQQVAAGA